MTFREVGFNKFFQDSQGEIWQKWDQRRAKLVQSNDGTGEGRLYNIDNLDAPVTVVWEK